MVVWCARGERAEEIEMLGTQLSDAIGLNSIDCSNVVAFITIQKPYAHVSVSIVYKCSTVEIVAFFFFECGAQTFSYLLFAPYFIIRITCHFRLAYFVYSTLGKRYRNDGTKYFRFFFLLDLCRSNVWRRCYRTKAI